MTSWCRRLLHACCWPLRGGKGEDSLELRPRSRVLPGDRGPEIVVNGTKVQGSGRCYANCIMEQDKVYFEVHIEDAGANTSCSIGCGARPPSDDLSKALGATPQSFGTKFGSGGHAVQAGDIIGCTYDQDSSPVTMGFWLNGVELPNAKLTGMKGDQLPALHLEGCTVNWVFSQPKFKNFEAVPGRFYELVPSTSLIKDKDIDL
eukprot:TRINITY_DN39873_c0_g1_i1.p1 TRINITY_DN39873_c0_g1~~TRINITY_DN39873_c0_g1_i1.p1  ORF type:complete len:204 (-),score=24.98 TRINITY_DN39873_c0_g1_i1:72-683(-)